MKQELTKLGISFNTFVEKGEFREALNKARGEGEESVDIPSKKSLISSWENPVALAAEGQAGGSPPEPSAPPWRRTRSMTPPPRRRSPSEQAWLGLPSTFVPR